LRRSAPFDDETHSQSWKPVSSFSSHHQSSTAAPTASAARSVEVDESCATSQQYMGAMTFEIVIVPLVSPATQPVAL